MAVRVDRLLGSGRDYRRRRPGLFIDHALNRDGSQVFAASGAAFLSTRVELRFSHFVVFLGLEDGSRFLLSRRQRLIGRVRYTKIPFLCRSGKCKILGT